MNEDQRFQPGTAQRRHSSADAPPKGGTDPLPTETGSAPILVGARRQGAGSPAPTSVGLGRPPS